MPEPKLIRNAARCLACGVVVVSEHRHDFESCGCPQGTFTDGGLEYIRRGGKSLSLIEDCSEYEASDA